jgi:cell wall-associated NlpC family hydrolase
VVVAFAQAQVGKPYRHAASGPGAYDCSGLAQAAYARVGVPLPHQTGGIAGRGRPVSRSELAPGDLVFTDPGHVGIYIGGGQMVHATTPSGGVKRTAVYRFAFARRVLA